MKKDRWEKWANTRKKGKKRIISSFCWFWVIWMTLGMSLTRYFWEHEPFFPEIFPRVIIDLLVNIPFGYLFGWLFWNSMEKGYLRAHADADKDAS